MKTLESRRYTYPGVPQSYIKMLKSLSRGGVESLACPINGVFTEDTGEFEDNISSSILQKNVVFVIICKKWFNCRSIH